MKIALDNMGAHQSIVKKSSSLLKLHSSGRTCLHNIIQHDFLAALLALQVSLLNFISIRFSAKQSLVTCHFLDVSLFRTRRWNQQTGKRDFWVWIILLKKLHFLLGEHVLNQKMSLISFHAIFKHTLQSAKDASKIWMVYWSWKNFTKHHLCAAVQDKLKRWTEDEETFFQKMKSWNVATLHSHAYRKAAIPLFKYVCFFYNSEFCCGGLL